MVSISPRSLNLQFFKTIHRRFSFFFFIENKFLNFISRNRFKEDSKQINPVYVESGEEGAIEIKGKKINK